MAAKSLFPMASESPFPRASKSSSPTALKSPSPRVSKSTTPPALDAVPQTSLNDQLLIAALYPASLSLASFSTLLFTPQANYFSQKHNIFNVFFVKNGWFWTTVVYAYHASRLRRTPPLQAFLRWALATMWWYFVTQWCFGPPIVDRTFMVTGGGCQLVDDSNIMDLTSITGGDQLVTSAACKMAKGKWSGGHDLSGHVFMLTHASLFLWNEILPVLKVGGGQQLRHGATWAMGALLVVWWWMLLMTGVYFHTWREKLTGFLASLIEWAVVYILSTEIPPLREILGVPGL